MKNNKELFMREYLCEWNKLSEGYIKAYKLWIKYYYECERFDQFVCTGDTDEYGFVKPSDGFETLTINGNASYLINNLYMEAKTIGISSEDIKRAKQDANRLTCKGLQEEYRRLFNANKA